MLPPSSDPESFFQPSARRLTNLKIRKLLKNSEIGFTFRARFVEWPRGEVPLLSPCLIYLLRSLGR